MSANILKAPTLAEYRAQCDRETCSCGGKLSRAVEAYMHPDGWIVDGVDGKLWLSVKCANCKQDWSLTHLGVPRPFGNRSIAERAKLDPHLQTNE